jgi:hypothetical protein
MCVGVLYPNSYVLLGLGCFLLFGIPMLTSLLSAVGDEEDDDKMEKKYKFQVFNNHLKKDLTEVGALFSLPLSFCADSVLPHHCSWGL